MEKSSKKQGAQPKFSKPNDIKLLELVEQYGTHSWMKIAKYFKNKTPKQCRDRWNNYVNPDIKRTAWTKEEDKQLLDYYSQIGPQWTVMMPYFGNRTPGDIRFRYLKLNRHEMKKPKKCTSPKANNKPALKRKKKEEFVPIVSKIIDTPKKIVVETNFNHQLKQIDIACKLNIESLLASKADFMHVKHGQAIQL